MANNPLSTVSVQQFRDTFTNKYEGVRKLQGTVQEIHGITGDAYKWPILGDADMQLRGAYSSLISATILDHTRVVTTFTEYALNLPVDKGEQQLVNADERSQLAKKHANAMGRREDQWVMDAMDIAAVAADNDIANGGTNMTMAKLLQIKFRFDVKDVPADQRVVLMYPSQFKSLLALEKVTSTDYSTVRALNNGEINTFLGMTFLSIGDRSIGGLPKTGDIRTCFAWQHDAVGLVYNGEPEIDVEWSAERHSWISVSTLSAGASVVLPEGLVKIDCDETA